MAVESPKHLELSRRHLLQAAGLAAAAAAFPAQLLAALEEPAQHIGEVDALKRFPHFQSVPVSYLNVTMTDGFWAPRQRVVRAASVSWATRHYDDAGGIDAFRQNPQGYVPKVRRGDLEAIKFVEALSAVVGLQRDPTIEAMTRAWGGEMIASQGRDGYWPFGWPLAADPARRWQPAWWSHEDYALGHYLESAIAFRESTGDAAMYDSAVRAVDNMASTLLDSKRAYAPGHAEIEQSLMRLYGLTGNQTYLRLCGWLIGQRGHHDGRRSFGSYSQDSVPVEQQRTIEGHAVRAAFLYNGVTEYVGATGHQDYREAVLAIWNDFTNHKMYLHGGGGITSADNEGYSSKPDFIPPGDCYGESCSVFGNFQWAHNLFRLTGDAAYLDVAERMLYNAFYASLSLQGDRFFYRNLMQQDEPVTRFAWHPVPCCPPNIVKLFSKVGGFFYSTDSQGIYVKHYGSSTAQIAFAHGVELRQRTDFPWDGRITLELTTERPVRFALRLRAPAWAKTHTLLVNGATVDAALERGWLVIDRRWKTGDTVELSLPMEVERVTMPASFKEYADLAALQRGPIVYCLEEQDMPIALRSSFEAYLPEGGRFTAEHRPDLLGGVTVLRGELRLPDGMDDTETPVPVTFIPYGVWGNRAPGVMRVWLPGRKKTFAEEIQFLDESVQRT